MILSGLKKSPELTTESDLAKSAKESNSKILSGLTIKIDAIKQNIKINKKYFAFFPNKSLFPLRVQSITNISKIAKKANEATRK